MIIHKPVLLKEVLDFMPANPKLIVDGTLGHGGHMVEMIKTLQNNYPETGIQFL
ncbi:16S rRNA (cytosine(1402)-N(4))-methyltransferase [Patescibacteria group bacterium]|nr:16S rRNA (cytosine(1402)-N(4))-methyltransferase [Patescibacteria group bacterium]MBU1757586.1 16S rRNA (cytosine(1402)-N(4))-methyltransferase [Patescibacteria group bacterium]